MRPFSINLAGWMRKNYNWRWYIWKENFRNIILLSHDSTISNRYCWTYYFHFLNVYFMCKVWSRSIDVVYWPLTRPNMPLQRRGSCIFHWRRWAWLTIWDKVKPHGTLRLMHRKRVTCELHNSYFRSMTIKYASGSDTSQWPVMGRYWVGDWTII